VPLIYVPLWLAGAPVSSIAVRTRSDPVAVGGIHRSAVASLDLGLPIANVQTMQEIDSATVAERRFQMGLTVAFAVASLLITALGTYGVLAYTVTQRRRELAVRAALGAWRGHLARLVFRRGLAPVIVGLGLGIATALAVGRALSSLLFQVTAADPVTIGAVSAVTLGAALLACWLPVRRAARASPLDALRSE
jgi:putative ABC transport system permease protein